MDGPVGPSEPGRRRRRPAISCVLCRRRKLRCDRQKPCSNCARSRNGTCIYEDGLSPVHGKGNATASGSVAAAEQLVTPPDSDACYNSPSTIRADRVANLTELISPGRSSHESATARSENESTLPYHATVAEIESLRRRIRQLEKDLPTSTRGPAQSHSAHPPNPAAPNLAPPNPAPPNPAPPNPASTGKYTELDSRFIGNPTYIVRDTPLSDIGHLVPSSIIHKQRMCGQSYWMTCMFSHIQEILDPTRPRPEMSKVFHGLQRCKSLARVIKAHRRPPWPTPLTLDLPSKDLADELVNCYLRTSESVYRVLHVPSFRRDYEELWMPGSSPDKSVVVQVKLVLALGAAVYDEQFSLRASAIRWVYESNTWLADPAYKSRLNIRHLQNMILLLLAQETVCVKADMVWISAGSLLRMAMFMGLHRDPARLLKVSTRAAEMRRRLWNTILEISVQLSMRAGQTPLLSLDDFDTAPPDNFNDEQLSSDEPVPKPDSEFTQVSIARAMRKTLPLRLAIVKYLNGLGSSATYEETLRYDTELRAATRTLHHSMEIWKSNVGNSLSHYAEKLVIFIMNRYFLALHIPFFNAATHENNRTAYAYSRKVVVEATLKTWCLIFPQSSILSEHDKTTPNDLAQLALNGARFFYTTAFQAVFYIAIELKTQLKEEVSLGPVPLRKDLLSVLQEAKEWSIVSVRNGETNIRGCLLTAMATAYVDGLMRGLNTEELALVLIKAAEETEEQCLPILESMVAEFQAYDMPDSLDPSPESGCSQVLEDWKFSMVDTLFDFGSAQPIDWTTQFEPGYQPDFDSY